MRVPRTGASNDASASGFLEWPDPDLPRLPRTYVPRRRVADQLDRATQAPVTLLVAPAGAGKTLGVSAWLQGVRGDDETDLARPELAETTWVHADRTWDAGRVRQLLDRAADRDDVPRLVVVDDAHDLPPSSLRLIDQRLTESPQSLRVLLLSRWDLPLTRFVPELLGHITVLRGECCGWIATRRPRSSPTTRARPRPRCFEAISARAQGWCAAIVLAARAVGATPDPVAAARHYARGDAIDRRPGGHGGVRDAPTPRTAPAAVHRRRGGRCGLDRSAAVARRAGRRGPGRSRDHRAAGEPGRRERHPELRTTPRSPADVRYRIHPLLAEVVRRRLVAGGVDVSRARATVVRAVRLDLSRGDTRARSTDWSRCTSPTWPPRCSPTRASAGDARARDHASPPSSACTRDVVDAHPAAWFAVALERWIVNDVEAAVHWMDRLLDLTEAGRDGRRRHRTRRAVGVHAADAGPARAWSPCSPRSGTPGAWWPSCRGTRSSRAPRSRSRSCSWSSASPRTGSATWSAAEANFTRPSSLGRFRDLPVVAAVGRVPPGVHRVHAGPRARLRAGRDRGAGTARGADLAHALHRGPGPPGPAARPARRPAVAGREPTPSRGAGPGARRPTCCTKFWLRMRNARLAPDGGFGGAAERALSTPVELPVTGPLPAHLAVVMLLERAFLAALASSGDLAGVEVECDELDAEGTLGEAAPCTGCATTSPATGGAPPRSSRPRPPTCRLHSRPAGRWR